MKTSYKFVKLSTALLASSLLSSYSAADDIDIYTDVVSTSASNADSAGHNILFVMDTSGSMADKVAAKSPKGAFDNSNIYGDPVSPQKIYVYDGNMTFTGHTIELDQNKCAGLAAKLSSDNPIYYDKGVQWQQTENIIPGELKCDDIPNSATSLSYNKQKVNAKRTWKAIKNFKNVGKNQPYSIIFKNHSTFGIDLSIGNDYSEGSYSAVSYTHLRAHET